MIFIEERISKIGNSGFLEMAGYYGKNAEKQYLSALFGRFSLFDYYSILDIPTLIAGCLLGFLIGMALMRIVANTEHKNIRKTAVKGSKNQILGELYEKVLPALPDFPYAPKDMLFVGKGCDYIIFDGLTEGRLREIIFLELKSGNARLTQNEAAIKYILDHKKVRFTEYRIDSVRNKE